jgi:hypothetical protein
MNWQVKLPLAEDLVVAMHSGSPIKVTDEPDTYWYAFTAAFRSQMRDPWSEDSGFVRVGPYLYLHKFKVLKLTPKGAWIQAGFSSRMFVLRNARAPRIKPTVEAARISFLAIQRRAIEIMQARIQDKEAFVKLMMHDWQKADPEGVKEAIQ